MSTTKVLWVGGQSRDLGPEHVMEAMFTTISCRLESNGRGTRFPTVMEDLYSGYLKPGRAPEALRELGEIEVALRRTPVTSVVWSVDNLQQDDANEPVNHQAANAFEYFVDAQGQPLICRMQSGVQECLRTAQVLRVGYRQEARDGILGGLILVLLGGAWMLAGRALVPGLSVASGYNFKARIPLWTFAMDLVMLGVAILVALVSPGIRDWFRRRPPALIAVAITAILGWLVVCARSGFLPD